MLKKSALYIFLTLLLANCASYKQNIMFKPGENFVPDPIKGKAQTAERNYVIQKNDFLVIEIYSNNGEKLIDPNPEMTQSNLNSNDEEEVTQYLVDINGVAKFPMVGEIKVEGLTLRQAEQALQTEYEKFFKSPFVTLRFNNKRVIILGFSKGQVLPLSNDNTTLAEVLAMAGGIDNNSMSHNIRVLRGDQVFLADFSTVEGFQKSNMIIEPGDIVYVQPIRRPVAEGFRDYGILLTFIVSIVTLIAVTSK